jgi:hypothetical protein
VTAHYNARQAADFAGLGIGSMSTAGRTSPSVWTCITASVRVLPGHPRRGYFVKKKTQQPTISGTAVPAGPVCEGVLSPAAEWSAVPLPGFWRPVRAVRQRHRAHQTIDPVSTITGTPSPRDNALVPAAQRVRRPLRQWLENKRGKPGEPAWRRDGAQPRWARSRPDCPSGP